MTKTIQHGDTETRLDSISRASVSPWLILIALLALALLAGCARLDDPKPTARETLPDATSPVRVSSERTDAAEPSVASGLDGSVYVAWVEHRGKDADVWLSRFDVEGKPSGAPARVNPNAGEATAWRGDAPTVAV